jgi:hypothetical protein
VPCEVVGYYNPAHQPTEDEHQGKRLGAVRVTLHNVRYSDSEPIAQFQSRHVGSGIGDWISDRGTTSGKWSTVPPAAHALGITSRAGRSGTAELPEVLRLPVRFWLQIDWSYTLR